MRFTCFGVLVLSLGLLASCNKPADPEAKPPKISKTKAAENRSEEDKDVPPPLPPPPASTKKLPVYHVPRLLFVLAGSNSMAANEARTLSEISLAINQFTRRQMDYYDVGLIQTGFGGGEACGLPVKTTTAAGYKVEGLIKSALAASKCKGAKTDIASALKHIATKELTKNPKTMVVVITTDKQSCGQDLCASAKELVSKSHDIYINVIAYGGSQARAKDFACVTEAGRGEFYRAKTSESLYDQIEISLGKNICPPMAMPCWEKGLSSRSETHRALVVDHCCSLKTPVAFRCPYKALSDSSEKIRSQANQCILTKNWSRKAEAMKTALKDDSLKIRTQVINHLEATPPTSRMKEVMAIAIKDKNLGLASKAVKVLVGSGHSWAGELFGQVMQEPREKLKIEALKSVSERYDPWVFEALKTSASDASVKLRLQAVSVAAGLKDKRAQEVLTLFTKDKNRQVSKKAQAGLASKE